MHKNKLKLLYFTGVYCMKRGLGRGLDALFSIYDEDEQKQNSSVKEEKVQEAFTSSVQEIDMRYIDPNKDQPRKRFEPNSLKELCESIKQHGVIQPIIVTPHGDNRYMIIAGERRFRASLLAGKKTIPAIIREYTKQEVQEVSLIENLQREDLNPIEAAKAIKQLMDQYSYTQETIADRIGKSRPLVANTLRLLSLCPEVIELIQKGQLSAGHGKILVVLTPEKQKYCADIIIEHKMTVREAESLVRKVLSSADEVVTKKEPVKQSPELKELCHRMQRLFGTKVAIKGNDSKGKISIEYFNIDDLNRICQFISKLER